MITPVFLQNKELSGKTDYKKLILIFPGYREPIGMTEGFEKFCAGFLFENEIIPLEYISKNVFKDPDYETYFEFFGRSLSGRAFRSIFFVFHFQMKYKKGCHFNP